LVASGLLPAEMIKTVPSESQEPLKPPDVRAQLAEALAEVRGLRAALARAEDEITFLRRIVTREQVA
jgi:hypothetical protein